jgi:ribosomal protein L11 methyltransferase
MAQSRLYFAAPKPEADRIFGRLEQEFEDDGFALANLELDEDSQIYEVSVYVESDKADAVAKRVSDCLNAEAISRDVFRENLPNIDWVAKSLEGLKPVRAGRFLVHGRHDRSAIRANDIAIEIEAGQAFGTGHHGTTAGCLQMLDQLARTRPPRNALDLGTGTGVLAIALARVAKCRVLATDIDPIATRVALENAKENGVARFTRFETAPGFGNSCFADEGPFDLIVANILARPLMAMSPRISANLSPGGDVVLSGILTIQRWRVLAAFRIAGLYHRRTIWRGEWVTLHLSAR